MPGQDVDPGPQLAAVVLQRLELQLVQPPELLKRRVLLLQRAGGAVQLTADLAVDGAVTLLHTPLSLQ